MMTKIERIQKLLELHIGAGIESMPTIYDLIESEEFPRPMIRQAKHLLSIQISKKIRKLSKRLDLITTKRMNDLNA